MPWLIGWFAGAGAAQFAVVVVILSDGMDAAGREVAAFAEIRRAASFHLGLSVVGRDAMLGAIGRPLDEEVRNCGTDRGCIAARLKAVGVDLGLLVIINERVDPPLTTGQLIRSSPAEELGALLVEDTGMPALLVALDAMLLQAGYTKGGRVEIDVAPPDATISLDGEAGVGTLVFEPGRYLVSAAHPDYIDSEQTVVVTRGDVTRINFELEARTGWWTSPWPWIAAGVVVVVGATVTGVLLRPQPDTFDFCHGSHAECGR